MERAQADTEAAGRHGAGDRVPAAAQRLHQREQAFGARHGLKDRGRCAWSADRKPTSLPR